MSGNFCLLTRNFLGFRTFVYAEQMRSIKNLVYLITGAANGIGRGTADYFLRHGGKVVLGDVAEFEGIEELPQSMYKNLQVVEVNVEKSEEVGNALRICEERFGRLDVVINAAGVACSFGSYNFTKNLPHLLKDYKRVIGTNLIGTFNVTRLAAAYLSRNEPNEFGERGVIINTSGFPSFNGMANQTALASAAGAVDSMTLPLAREFAKQGIRVLTICPGIFDTNMVGAIPETFRELLADMVQAPARMGKPEEFAHMAAGIVENAYLNGEVIKLDGALRMPA